MPERPWLASMPPPWSLQAVLRSPGSAPTHLRTRRAAGSDVRPGRGPGLARGQSAAYVVAEVWQGVPEAWLQPWYVLFQEPPTGPPAARIQNVDPVIDVVPPSFFYSPFWRFIDVVIPPGASPDGYRDARTLVDPSLPHIETNPLLAVVPPGARRWPRRPASLPFDR